MTLSVYVYYNVYVCLVYINQKYLMKSNPCFEGSVVCICLKGKKIY